MDPKIIAAIAAGALGAGAAVGSAVSGDTVTYERAKPVSAPDSIGLVDVGAHEYAVLAQDQDIGPGEVATSGVNLTAGARIAAAEVDGASLVSSQCIDFPGRTWCEVTVRNDGTTAQRFSALIRTGVP